MKRFFCIVFAAATAGCIVAQSPVKTDPYFTKEGGFGYSIASDAVCNLWWAEAAYKVMRDAPLPEKKDTEVKIWAARNEYESFILVVRPLKRMENFRISIPELKDNRGNVVSAESLTVRKVEYVKVSRPTDSYGFAGWWPDPLPLYAQPETIMPSENQPFWVTVKIPADAPAGTYTGNILLSAEGWTASVPIKLQVWDFTLPTAPSMRSGFGISMNSIKRYHNLNTPAEEREVFEYYMRSFRDYRISPYTPFLYSPIKEEVKGVPWKGGYFDSWEKHSGTYSYKVTDNSSSSNTEAVAVDLTPVNSKNSYNLIWYSRSDTTKQEYVAGLECFNAEKKHLVFENKIDRFTAGKNWKPDTLKIGKFNEEVRYVKVMLFPSNRTRTGEEKGTVWFDDITLINNDTRLNEFTAGNFEVNPNDIDIELDFTDFNNAGKKYFDEYGFTGYRLDLKGLGGGTFYSRETGVFEGFEQGTDEYNRLMERYLVQMQENLKKNGWLGREYIYWFDEPNEKDYPFVRETNAMIKKYAPGITTFLTEHVSGQDITDVTDISCTIWHRLDHDKIRKLNDKGLQHWSYLCTAPKSPWISLFTDHDAINMRMWLLASWQYRLKGILIWETTYWNSEEASPEGYLQNPWEEGMSFVTGYGWPTGKQTGWGNGDGRLFYPPNRDPNNDTGKFIEGPVPSFRIELMRDGIEDYEYFTILEKAVKEASPDKTGIAKEAAAALKIPSSILTDEKTYSKNPQDVLNYRKKIAELIIALGKN
jgi:hypothetical protein